MMFLQWDQACILFLVKGEDVKNSAEYAWSLSTLCHLWTSVSIDGYDRCIAFQWMIMQQLWCSWWYSWITIHSTCISITIRTMLQHTWGLYYSIIIQYVTTYMGSILYNYHTICYNIPGVDTSIIHTCICIEGKLLDGGGCIFGTPQKAIAKLSFSWLV